MRSSAKKLANFGILTALSLILGYVDRAIPIMNGMVPGIKLGLANTVLLYAVYLMDMKSCLLLMCAKVLLSGFLFGSMSSILYSFSGGVLSLALMLLVRRDPRMGAITVAGLALLSDAAILLRVRSPRGAMLWCVILIACAFLASVAVCLALRKRPDWGVMATSLAGAVAHNVGQILVASAVLKTPQLMYSYLPVLVGLGAAVGCLTGFVARRVFRALRLPCE